MKLTVPMEELLPLRDKRLAVQTGGARHGHNRQESS
jgi:hypothetical protein